MPPLDAIIERIIDELVAERNPAFVSSDMQKRPPDGSPRQLVSDLVYLLWKPNQRVAKGSPRYEAMLDAITKSARWRRMRMHFCEVQQQIASRQEETKLGELSEMFCFVVKNMVCRLVHRCESEAFGVDDLAEAYFSFDLQHEHLLDDRILVGMELARRAKMPRFLPQWIDLDLVQACLDTVREPSRHREWRFDVRMEDGDVEDRLPGNYSGLRGVTVKTREDQIPDILPPEWRYCNVSRGQIADVLESADGQLIDQYKDAIEKFGLKYVTEKCLVVERHRQNNVDVRQRILVPIIIGAEARVQGQLEMEAQTRARRLAFEFVMTAAKKIPALIDVDVAWFEQRDGQWVGMAFPLRSLTSVELVSERWMSLVVLDSVLPHFFLRWAIGAATKRFDCETIRDMSPTAFLEHRSSHVQYHAVSTVAITSEAELACYLPSPVFSVQQAKERRSSVLLATVSAREYFYRGATVRDLVAASVVNLPLPVVAENELVRKFITLLFGPPMDGCRRSFKSA